MKRWRSFPLQLFLFTVLPLTVLLLAVAFASLSLHQQAMRNMVGERDERAARAAAKAITDQLSQRQTAVRNLAQQAVVTEEPDHVLADTVLVDPLFEGGLVLFNQDNGLLGMTSTAETWLPLFDAAALQQKNGSLVMADSFILPFLTPVTGEPLMLVTASSGDYTAVGAFSPAHLSRRALNDIFGNNDQAITFVTTAEGQILYQAGNQSLVTSNVTQQPGVADALRGESGTTYLTIDGEEYVIAFSPIAPVGWALIIKEPWREVADPLLRATELAPLVLIPVLIITLTGLWFGLRQIVQPLQSLEKQATQLGWGDFTAIEKPVGGINEIQRLQTELVHMAQKVQLAQQSLRGYLGAITTAQEEERRRLARELHDDTIQSLIGLNQRVQLAQMNQPEASLPHLEEMAQMVNQTITDLRRIIHDLRPIYLEDLGLIPALEMLARDRTKELGMPVTFTVTGTERRLSSLPELALYRIAQEGLNNVARHAQATEVEIQLHFSPQQVTLDIRDDGQGFDIPESPAEMSTKGHYGLLGIQERAELMGAKMSIISKPAEGTSLKIVLATDG